MVGKLSETPGYTRNPIEEKAAQPNGQPLNDVAGVTEQPKGDVGGFVQVSPSIIQQSSVDDSQKTAPTQEESPDFASIGENVKNTLDFLVPDEEDSDQEGDNIGENETQPTPNVSSPEDPSMDYVGLSSLSNVQLKPVTDTPQTFGELDGYTSVFSKAPPDLTTVSQSDLPSSTGGTRMVLNDPVFKTPEFQKQYSQIKGKANLMSKNMEKFGDPRSAGWSKENLTKISTPSGKSLTVNKKAASAFEGFISELESSGYKIKSIGGYNLRSKRGGSSLSEHAFGNAIDINWFKDGNGFSKELKTNLPANISQLAAKYGLSWGGDWKGKKDAMHFEWTGIAPVQPEIQVASNR